MSKIGTICGSCAKAKGCIWPEGHMATLHEGLCSYCKKIKAVCSSGDWNWPDKEFHGMRD